jgi:uncharacterized low-complexity protein
VTIRSHVQLGAALTALLGSAAYCQASSLPFQANPLISGYAVAAADATRTPDEGKCGEGKCGIPMMDTDKDGKVSVEESKLGHFSIKQFKAWDANGDGFLDKKELDAMHATKGKEGYCS